MKKYFHLINEADKLIDFSIKLYNEIITESAATPFDTIDSIKKALD